MAIDAAGDVAAGTANNPASPDVYVYHQGGDTALNTYNLASSGANLMPRGLAWSPDGSQLFAVLHGSAYSVQVITGPTLIRPTLAVTTGPTTFTYEPTVHVTAHLGTTSTNRAVSIYAQQFGSKSKTLLKTGNVNTNGNLTASYQATHSTTFSVVFVSDQRYAPEDRHAHRHVRAKCRFDRRLLRQPGSWRSPTASTIAVRCCARHRRPEQGWTVRQVRGAGTLPGCLARQRGH